MTGVRLTGPVKAIAAVLDNKFGYEVYTDEIKMGFESPSFFIEVIDSRRDSVNGSRFKMKMAVNIHYFPREAKGKSVNEQILLMADALYELLEVFPYGGGSYRSHNMSHKEHDGRLMFSLDVNYHVKTEPTDEYMESLEHKIRQKTMRNF